MNITDIKPGVSPENPMDVIADLRGTTFPKPYQKDGVRVRIVGIYKTDLAYVMLGSQTRMVLISQLSKIPAGVKKKPKTQGRE